MNPPFPEIINTLEKFYGSLNPVPESDPLNIILLENVAYLVGDDQRERAFNALRDRIGLIPADILSASPEELFSVAEMGGPMPELRIKKLCDIATTAIAEFDGDLRKILGLPLAQAKKALKKFPGIGDPGADKILLFCWAYAVPAFESNGLRALTRLGFTDSGKSYSSAYKQARDAVLVQTGPDFNLLIKAYHLLRRHGQELCKQKAPLCGPCPLKDRCPYFAGMDPGFV